MQEKVTSRPCPYCKEEIKPDAIRCKHCRSSVPPEKPPHGGICPYCKEAIHAEAIKCKHCGVMLGPEPGGHGCGCGGAAVVGGPPAELRAARSEGRSATPPGSPGPSGPFGGTSAMVGCGGCEYGGMIDPFAGLSYGIRVCCRTEWVRSPGGGWTWQTRCWNDYSCPTLPWSGPGPVIWA